MLKLHVKFYVLPWFKSRSIDIRPLQLVLAKDTFSEKG